MSSQRFLATSASVLTLSYLVGCASNPAIPESENSAPQPAPTGGVAGDQFMTPPMQLRIDPDAMSAEVEFSRMGEAQPPQAISFDFDIANFVTPASFVITGVGLDGDGNFVVDFQHSHPFPAADIAQPVSATNRADLGYTGRLLVLSSSPPQLFFDGTVRLEPSLVRRPDGFVNPGDLLQNDEFRLANTFPYVLLADEEQDNRVGISNGGDPEGNYAAASGGWQQVNLGNDGNAWTGFDFIHGGQTISNSFTLDRQALLTNNNVVDLVFLIKYTDPRGMGGPDLRLPPESIDVTEFAYRLPFAALDNSQIEISDPLEMDSTAGHMDTFGIEIRDWDTRADEAGDADLADETDVALIQPGASGIPTVRLDAPDVLSAPASLTGLRGTGAIGDEMVFGADITQDFDLPQGQYYGVVEIVDKENALDRSSYYFGVDAETLAASPDRALDAITYQVVPYSPPLPPLQVTGVIPTGTAGVVGDEVNFHAFTSRPVTGWQWDFGDGASPQMSTEETPAVFLQGPAGIYEGTVTVFAQGRNSGPTRFSYRVENPPAPGFRSHIAWNEAMPSAGVDFSIASLPGNLAIAYANVSDTGIAVAVSDDASPSASSDWNVITFDPTSGIGAAEVNCIEFQGRLAMVYHNFGANNIAFSYTSVEVPTSGSEFASYLFDIDGTRTGIANAITKSESRLAVAYDNSTTGEVRYAYASPGMPTQTSDWTAFEFATANVDGSEIAIAMDESERIALGFLETPGVLDIHRFMISTVSEPGLADWMPSYSLGVSTFGPIDMQFSNGRFELLSLFEDGVGIWYYRAKEAVPEDFEDWDRLMLHLSPGGAIGGLDLVSFDNRTYCVFDESNGSFAYQTHLFRALVPDPINAADWLSTIAATDSIRPVMTLSDDRIWITYSAFDSPIPYVSGADGPW